MLIFQKIYKQEDARRNPDVLYVFGDNVLRKGKAGQAAEMRDEPNGIGVATKYTPGMGGGDFFGNDPAEVIAQNRIIDEDMKPLFRHLIMGGIVVWPSDSIGTGYSKLPTYAPLTYEHVQQKLAALIRVGKLFHRGMVEKAKIEAEPHV